MSALIYVANDLDTATVTEEGLITIKPSRNHLSSKYSYLHLIWIAQYINFYGGWRLTCDQLKTKQLCNPFITSHIPNVDFNYLKLPGQVFQRKLNGGDNKGRGVSPTLTYRSSCSTRPPT